MYSYQNVTLAGFHFEASSLTVNLNGADVNTEIGVALTVDTSAANTLKLAGDGDPIVARLASFEDRTVEGTKVGAAEFQFANKMPIANGATINIGDTAVGAGNGEVKRLDDGTNSTPDYSQNFVAEIIGNYAVVVKI